MLRVFVLDGTEKSLYYSVVSKYISEANLKVETSTERAITRIPRNVYDLIVVSNCTGNLDVFDVADMLKESRLNNKAEIILLMDNPTVASKFSNVLRGRRVHNLKSNQLEQLGDLLERMSS